VKALRLLAGASVVACSAVCPVAAHAQDDSSRLIVVLDAARTPRHDFYGDLLYNCNLFFSGGRVPDDTDPSAHADGPPVGSIDFAHSRGSAFLSGYAWQAEALAPYDRPRPVKFADIGVELAGRRIYLTARITHGRRALLQSVRRERLAVVRTARREDGTLRDRHGRPAPNTFTYIARGRLTMLPAMSRALERTRCKDRRHNPASHRLKPGYWLGRLTVALRQDQAAGLGGDVLYEPDVTTPGDEDDVPVAVEPTGGVTRDRDGVLHAPMASGLPVPLLCESGVDCFAAGGSIGLGGGFDLVLAGRRASVTNVVVTTTLAGDTLTHSVTGTLDGSPVTIAEGLNAPLTDDFAQRAGTALGVPVDGGIGLLLRFTRTGAP
jgi:hypothetical protein